MRHSSVIVLGAILALSTGVSAQSSSPRSYRLELKPNPKISTGKATFAQGTASPAGDRFFVEHLSIIQPVIVTIITQNPDDDVKLQLSKYRFDAADRTASTRGSGRASIKLRTQGEMKIVVTGAEPKKYQLIVWAGDEIKPEPPSIVLKGGVGGAGGGWRGALLVAGLLVGALLLAAFWRRKNAAAAAVALALFVLPATLEAQGPTAITADRLWRDVGEILDIAGMGSETIRDFREFQEAFEHLNEGDGRYDPDYRPEGMPDVPISCATEECQQCYESAVRRLNFTRVTFEQLRAIYQSTTDMADKAMSFGDSASGIHALSGLSWQYSKKGIQTELAKLGRTYDEKYKGLLGTLRSSLDEMSVCERDHFDNPDWYNRFGFIYYTFMEDRYRR